MQKLTKSIGFTLLELLIVVSIIGILAAVVLPRFISEKGSARIAALNGLASAINVATELAEAEYIAEGNDITSLSSSINMNHTPVNVVPGSGRPVATALGIGTAVQTISGFSPIFSNDTAIYNFTEPVANCYLSYNDATGYLTIKNTGC